MNFSVREPEPNEIEELLKTDERYTVEFKSKEKKPAELQETFVAFANADGGNLYIGIEEEKRGGDRIVGFNKIEEANEIIKVLLNDTSPVVDNVFIEFIDLKEKGYILHVEVPKSPTVHYTSKKTCFKRINASNVQIKGEQITNLIFNKGQRSFEDEVCTDVEVYEVINSPYLVDYLKRIKTKLDPHEFLLKNKLLSKRENNFFVKICCILLFHENPQIVLNKKCSVVILALDSSEEYTREVLKAEVRISGPIENQINKTLEWLYNYFRKCEHEGIVYRYPFEALKELIVNAIVHRDYNISKDIQIIVYLDRIEIISPGGLPHHVTKENIYLNSETRNNRIVEMLSRLPESPNKNRGEGLKTVFDTMKEVGLSEPVIIPGSDNVKVVLFNNLNQRSSELYSVHLNRGILDKGKEELFKKGDVYKDNFQHFYKNQLSSVTINAFLPLYPDVDGSCLIVFDRVKECLISFNHNMILGSLFEGLYTEPNWGLRGFVVNFDKEKNEYTVQLGNNRIQITAEECSQLCQIIDDMSLHYLGGLWAIESALGTFPFEKSEYTNRYRLLKIKKVFWKKIVQFMREHDFDKGNSEWHIFDANDHMIKVFTKASNFRYKPGYHVILYVDEAENYNVSTINDEVWIEWEPFYDPSNKNTLENYNERTHWNAEQSFNWLTKELIPYVVYYFEERNRKKLFTKTKSFDEFISTFELSSYASYFHIKRRYIPQNIYTIEELYEFANELQRSYSLVHTNLLFEKAELEGLYRAIQLCLEKTEVDNYGYIKGNLSFVEGETREEIVSELENHISRLDIKNKVHSFAIDTALRCIVVLLRDHENCLSGSDISTISQYLDFLYQKYLLLDTLKRFKNYYATR